MRLTRRLTALLLALTMTWMTAGAQSFVPHGKPDKLLSIDLHAMIGGTEVVNNLTKTFPEISEMDMSMGTAFGVGATAEIAFSRLMGMGVQTNFLIGNYRYNVAVANDEGPSMTNVFIRNRFYALNFPVYATAKFNLGSMVKWNVDLGLYYQYGLGGHSKATLYNARVNELGQLVTVLTHQNASYYNSRHSFLTSHYRGDIGLHAATGFTFAGKVKVGVACQVGFKNISHVYDAVSRPNLHNFNFFCQLGWVL